MHSHASVPYASLSYTHPEQSTGTSEIMLGGYESEAADGHRLKELGKVSASGLMVICSSRHRVLSRSEVGNSLC